MKRLRSGPFFVGLALLFLQILSFAGIVKGGGSIFPQPSGPLGRIHPYDLGVFLVSALPGIIGVVLIVVSIVRRNSSPPPSEDPETPADTASTKRAKKFFTSHSTELVLFLVLLVFIASVFNSKGYEDGYADGAGESWDLGRENGYEAGREAGYETGLDEGYRAGFSDGTETGYNSGYAASENSYAWEYRFFRQYACIVTTTGDKYHHYGCCHIEGQPYYIYNIELAEAKGYLPCPDCWEHGLEDLPLPPLALPSLTE